jgi:hypothetical protein
MRLPEIKAAGAPHEEYARRLRARQAVSAAFERRHIVLGNLKLVLSAAAAVIAWLAFGRHWFSPWWLAAPAAAFVPLALFHERVIRRRRLADRAAAFYERGLARIEDRWSGQGSKGERFDDPVHPYARDLDLFGEGSLFELLSIARLRTGEETLARWLLAPASLEEIRLRRAAIEELRPMLDLREDLALLGEDLPSSINPGLLARWGEQPPVLNSRVERAAAFVLSLFAAATVAVWAAFGMPEPFLFVIAAEVFFYLRVRPRVARVVGVVGEPAYGLALFAAVLERLERESFQSPKLAGLQKSLRVAGAPPHRQIARLNRWMELLHSQDHLLMRIIGPPLLWSVQVAYGIEAWRRKSGPKVRRWIEAAGEIEALCSLANYAYEHPDDPFPEFTEGGACFAGESLGHPLLPAARMVRNDVRLSDGLRVMVISGSNMSGKSTLLRTVGVNAVLAMTGAPVRARKLRLSPLMVGASIRTLDSLHGGTSRFYAEITRLRQLVDITRGPVPLLFLLDELLQGTNSHDRRIGGEAVVREFAARGAIGLLTTHDLALAHIAEVLAPHGTNMHFEDYLVDGTMKFDYRLLSGVVRKSNALELMRSVGLEV